MSDTLLEEGAKGFLVKGRIRDNQRGHTGIWLQCWVGYLMVSVTEGSTWSRGDSCGAGACEPSEPVKANEQPQTSSGNTSRPADNQQQQQQQEPAVNQHSISAAAPVANLRQTRKAEAAKQQKQTMWSSKKHGEQQKEVKHRMNIFGKAHEKMRCKPPAAAAAAAPAPPPRDQQTTSN